MLCRGCSGNVLSTVNRITTMQKHTDQTLSYYEQNAKAFYDNTVDVNFKSVQQLFTDLLPQGAKILDFGCGSGRDTVYFLSQGYDVDAIDGSAELCCLASEAAGIPVRQMYFQDLDAVDEYDGIWACASILHVPKKELPQIFLKMQQALEKDGVIYASFKYGEGETEKDERKFTNYTLESVCELMEGTGFRVLECDISYDVRPGREEKWVNVIAVS